MRVEIELYNSEHDLVFQNTVIQCVMHNLDVTECHTVKALYNFIPNFLSDTSRALAEVLKFTVMCSRTDPRFNHQQSNK